MARESAFAVMANPFAHLAKKVKRTPADDAGVQLGATRRREHRAAPDLAGRAATRPDAALRRPRLRRRWRYVCSRLVGDTVRSSR
jgi:hypothetical protein